MQLKLINFVTFKSNIVPILRMSLQFITENEQIKEQVALFLEEWENNNSFFETKTSGSTGVPKTIQIDKKHAEASAKATIDFLKLKPSDNSLLCLNIHTIGGKMMVIRSIISSMNLYIEEPRSNPLKNTAITFDFIAIAPVQLATILEESPEQLKKIRCVIVGGGSISKQIELRLKQKEITVYQTFGMTETISHIALRKVGYEQEESYTTLNHISVSEKNNQLHIHAPRLGIRELRTTDSVEILNKHQFKWLGRTDFVINSGGIKIQIEELEKELQNQIPGKFFIHPKKDDKLGEKIVIITEGNEQQKLKSKSFYSFLKNKYHIPKEIAFLSNFILTPSHKINRIANFEQIDEHGFKQIL